MNIKLPCIFFSVVWNLLLTETGYCFIYDQCPFCHHGHCVGGPDGPHCQCDTGWTGTTCFEQYGCSHYPCRHGGDCEMTATSPYFKCHCHYGFTGDTCESTHCDSSPCKNNGICHQWSEYPYYICNCAPGVQGYSCEVHPCELKPCQNGYVCNWSPYYPYYTCFVDPTHAPTSAKAIPTSTGISATSPKISLLSTVLAITSTNSSISPTNAPSPTLLEPTKPSTPNALNISFSCLRISVIEELVKSTTATNQNAPTCPSGSHSSPEAFVLNHCNTGTTTGWTQGENVMSVCSRLPTYIPIASFNAQRYSSPGIFIGCLHDPDGFKFVKQKCDRVPEMIHLVEGNTTDPHSFYTINE